MTLAIEPYLTVLIAHGVEYKKILIRHYDTTDYKLQQIAISWEHFPWNENFRHIQSLGVNERHGI